MGSVVEDAWCARCGAGKYVTWCPAFQAWLCESHRYERTYKELDATDRPDGWLHAQSREVTVVTL